MTKKELVKAMIEQARSEGTNIKFDHQFGYDGFVDGNGEFWSTDGWSMVEICRKISSVFVDEPF